MTQKKNRGLFWLLCLASAAAFFLLLTFKPEWIWLSLPTTFGGLALAMDWI